MDNDLGSAQTVTQVLRFDKIARERLSSPDTLFANTGRRLYVIGDIDGGFRPRSNPYDMYKFGAPDPNDPLAGKLQGVWAQPVKGLDAYGYCLELDGQPWELVSAERFTQTFASVEFVFQRADLRCTRHDFVPLDLPVLFSALTIENLTSADVHVRVAFWARFDLQDAWFISLAERRNQGQTVAVEDGCLVARAEVLPEVWSTAITGLQPADEIRLLEGGSGELVYDLLLATGGQAELVFCTAVVSCGESAVEILRQALPRHLELLREKQACYQDRVLAAPRLVSPDPLWNEAFTLALANIQMMETEQDNLGCYFYAGLEMFPFWFSGDAYSLVGELVGGWVGSALNHMEIGMRYQQQGRIPHQVSPSGRLLFPGNALETPLWVASIWEAYRWTGDRDFLARLYPTALRGLLEYTLGTIDTDGDGYASGPGAVEREMMGEEKLDTAAQTWLALKCLAEMAQIMEDFTEAQRSLDLADKIAANFEEDWWDPTAGTYAMSLDQHNRRHSVPHWAIVVPVHLCLASPEHAAATFELLRVQYLNRWGLKHTVGDDERVWTLPTAVLSRAAFRYGQLALGFEMLGHIAETLQHGPVGMFHELIPQGACFVQLWSAATYIRGVVEDLFGITVRADLDEIRIQPALPAGWRGARLERLSFGDHVVDVEIGSGGNVSLRHTSGLRGLRVVCGARVASLLAGETWSI